MDTIEENIKKRRGRPPKPKPENQAIPQQPQAMPQQPQAQQTSYNDLSEPQKRIYDVLSIFNKLDNAQAIIDYKIQGFTIEQLEKIFQNPIQNALQIAEVCRAFYFEYGAFRELIEYYIKPPYCRHTVNVCATGEDFKSVEEKDFIEYCAEVKRLKFNREFKRVLLEAHVQDVVCGYWLEEGNSRTLYYFPLSWVIVNGKYNGDWAYKLNTTKISEREIAKLPKEIATLVTRYKKNSGDAAQAPVPPEKIFCIKYSDHTNLIMPPFMYVIQLVVDLVKAKQLGLIKNEQDILNLISMEIPHTDQQDELLFTEKIIKDYASGANELVGDGTVVIPSPMKLSALPMSRSNVAEKNTVKDSMANINEETNSPSFGSSSTGAEMNRSIQLAESKVFTLMDQISSVINLKMEANGYTDYPGYRFEYELLKITRFNESEYMDNLLKQAQTGSLDKFHREAARGRSPDMVLGQYYIENVLYKDMWSNLTVLPTSYTQTNSGRPTNESQGIPLTDPGQQTVDIGGNDPNNRST